MLSAMRWVWIIAAAGMANVAASGQAASSIEVPAGARIVLEVRGSGVQIYRCTDAKAGFQWTLEV